ncbi:MAG: S1C family serine protease [Dehalococcoidia bacterium]
MTTLTSLATRAPRLAEETATLVERLQASVVLVRDGGPGAGSGVIWEPGGVIVTNYHVAPGERAHVTLHDGREFKATVRLSDQSRDLAILDIQARGLPAAHLGNSDRLRIGELVFAVGNPRGMRGVVTAGIISGLGHRYGRGRRRGEGLIQADVSLAPGNSGGLLATADGRVIGINAMFHMPGLALAVPSNAVTALIGSEGSGRAYLGVTLLETPLPSAWAAQTDGFEAGLLVTSVADGSPAEAAGLLLGDVIVRLGGRPIVGADDLGAELSGLRPGEPLELGLFRGGRPLTLSVVTGRALEEAA